MARRSPVVLAALLAPAVAVAACQTGTPPGPSALPGSSGPRPTSLIGPPLTAGPPPSPTPPDEATPVALDPALLDILPEMVAGFPVGESIDQAASALNDPALPRIATALDAGVAVDTASGNLVYAIVVRLREGAFDDDAYRQWRDSFDEGACAAAGGVVGRAQATIDERNVFVTSCVTGLLIYHLWLAEEDLLISAPSVGDGRFGELLMGELRV